MNNKNRTKEHLLKYNIPVPKSVKFSIKSDNINSFLNKIDEKLNYPLVIKPTNESQSKGVHLNITNRNDVKKIIIKLSKKYNELIIEEFVKGNLYRILIINNKIIDVIVRPFPYVIGDGKLYLNELVNKRNISQKIKKLTITTNIHYDYIKSQNININQPIPKNKKVYITRTPTIHNGCNPFRVDLNKIHNDNLNLFLKINKVLGSNISGIDYITKDIIKSYKDHNNYGFVIEVNSGPSYEIHKKTSPSKDISPEIVKQIYYSIYNKY